MALSDQLDAFSQGWGTWAIAEPWKTGDGVPGEKGYRLEKAPISGTWFLINEVTGNPAVSDKGTTAFSVERAIKFLGVEIR